MLLFFTYRLLSHFSWSFQLGCLLPCKTKTRPHFTFNLLCSFYILLHTAAFWKVHCALFLRPSPPTLAQCQPQMVCVTVPGKHSIPWKKKWKNKTFKNNNKAWRILVTCCNEKKTCSLYVYFKKAKWNELSR